MAALGCSTATTQMGQFCAAKYNNARVAGFQAVTQQAVNDRRQSCSVAEMGSRAAIPTREGRLRTNQYNSAWGRGNNTIISGQWPSSESQSRGLLGSFLQIFRPSTNASNSFGNNFGEGVRVDNRPREPAQEPEWLEAEVEPPPKAGDNRSLNVVEVKKAAQNANVATTAVDKGTTVATSALDKVGDVLRNTGLEINLDVGLKELTIEKLVLRDLGLVLAVKTKPQQQAQAESPQAENDKGGNNTA